MNRQAIVGFFTLIALAGLFTIFYVLENLGAGEGRYLVGVHFKSAAGLHKGALVYESGVQVGIVDSVSLQPDFSVEVILAVNNHVDVPQDARYSINAPLTGDVTLEIVPPPPSPGTPVATLPHRILPIAEQPQGYAPPSIADVLQQGEGEVARLDRMLSELQKREPALLDELQSALRNADELASSSNRQIGRFSTRLNAMMDTLTVALDASGRNIVDLTGRLDAVTARNSDRIDSLVANLNQTARALNETVDSARDLAADPKLRQNLIDTTTGLAQTAQTIAEITEDLHRVTGNAQTQAQMRDAVANVDAATQKLDSLLGSLGGRSSVYGVDRGATPAPAGSAAPLPPAAGASPAPAPSPFSLQNVRARLGNAARDLLALQIRLSELDPMPAGSSSSPLLTSDRGPQTDVNLIALPRGRTSLLTGANDIGTGATTWNFALEEALHPGFELGGGVLYSRLGMLARYEPPGPFSFEGRLYDPRFPTLDAYAGLKVAPQLQLFGGERDVLHSGRRTVFGLQLQF
jgi:phospholipid/cholesterol/gamma-HCH transport system substrate-binding protein